MQTTSSLEYTSFLFRLWRKPAGEPSAACQDWLVQIEHIPNGEQRYFTSLEDLFAFIREQLPGSSQEPIQAADPTNHASRTTFHVKEV